MALDTEKFSKSWLYLFLIILLELFTFLNASDITFSNSLLNSTRFYIPLPGNWLISLGASESCFIRKPRVWFAFRHILLIPPAHCHFYFYFRAQGSLKHLIFWGFLYPQLSCLFFYKKCILGNKSLLEKDSCSKINT